MRARILPFTAAAAWIALATPARAYGPSDPAGPPPDDPAASVNLPAAPRAPQRFKTCAMLLGYDPSAVSADDPAARDAHPDARCSCEMNACAQPRQRGRAHAMPHGEAATESVG